MAALEVKFQLKSLVVVSAKKQNYVFVIVIVIIVIGCRKAFKFYLLTFFIIFIFYWQTFDEWMNESDFTAESLQQIAKQSRSYTRAIHERI